MRGHVHAFIKMDVSVCFFQPVRVNTWASCQAATMPRNVTYAIEIGIAQGATWWKRLSETLSSRLSASLWNVAVRVLHVSPHVQHLSSFPQLIQFFHLATADGPNVEMAANESESKPAQKAHR